MKSIWYFVGLLLTVTGAIIAGSGIYSWIHPPEQPKMLSGMHPDLWWGLFMLVFGLAFAFLNRRKEIG